MSALTLALHFVRREIRNRYLGSFSGALWAILQPVLQLAVYSFAFVYIFKAPVPAGSTSGFVPFLFVALWPWNAFAESLVRATTSIQDNAALIGKVAMPREVLVFSAVTASFLVQMLGFVAICVAMSLFGVGIDLLNLPIALLGFFQLFLLALGFGFLLAGLQVFARDLSAALPQLLMLWMFASPIFYARESIPEKYRGWFSLNPFSPYPDLFRGTLLHSGNWDLYTQAISLLVAICVLGLGYGAFRRVEPHFEDFL